VGIDHYKALLNMAKYVVVVESPAKSKTIKKYLGKDFEVFASYGHVRDLLPKEGAVDPQQHFKMTYEIIERNLKHVQAIQKAIKNADALYLATDPDREGEAIAWHIHQILAEKNALEGKQVHRVAFYEITKKAVQAAIAHPRSLSQDLIDAQQARRALDYLVGFNLSPLLWRKVRPGLSAGRVQSPALRMIVERELEIEAFKSQEYWSIISHDIFNKQAFDAKLTLLDGDKQEQFSITTEKQAESAKKKLVKAANGELIVDKVDKKQRKRQPTAPFTTSTLQQEAARKLGFSARKTMQIAQQLYEGVDVGAGAEGLITYMRTDSVHIGDDAIAAIRQFIIENFGKTAVAKDIRIFKTKSKNAQEAHEAIRPTNIAYKPDAIKDYLTADQFKLYQLVWKRAVASQMIHATLDTVSVDLRCSQSNKHGFRANGSTLVDPGFIKVYFEDVDDKPADADDEEKMLPIMKIGDVVTLNDIECKQHFTEPPPRYSEASLVKALEEHGIGRPSTYAAIIQTLTSREYALLDKKRFTPTDVGRVVNKFLTNYFTQYVDYNFTANLEDQLDEISRGEKQWVPVLETFWDPFKLKIDDVAANVQRKDVTQEALDEKCPDCGNPLSIRLGKRGRFIGCTTYPECKYTRSLEGDAAEETAPEIVADRKCPSCEHDLVIKLGRYGKFIGCSQYPTCKHIEPLEKPKDLDIECPECKTGTMLQRKSRYGKIFFSCSTYPTCKYATWNEPLKEPCSKCHWPIMTLKVTKRWGTEKACPQKECGYKEKVETAEE
jgi:DNA topoisomerase-1